jgi:nucleoside-specific outer membrane channel protein Tsx
VVENFSNATRPIYGEAIPMLGLVAFMDLNWSDMWTSTIGYSMLDNDLPNGQSASSYEKGQYALANILYHPVPNVMYGLELQWAERANFTDGFKSDDTRLQFSAKYNFGKTFGGN